MLRNFFTMICEKKNNSRLSFFHLTFAFFFLMCLFTLNDAMNIQYSHLEDNVYDRGFK